jgi:hypothetical protein
MANNNQVIAEASGEVNSMEERAIAADNLTGTNHGALYPNFPLKYLTASTITGDKVHNDNNEDMGEIKDIMINVINGSIEYYIIEFGGFLGIGTKYFAIPFRFLQVDAEKKSFIFRQERKTLEGAPGFDMDHWPNTNIHLEKVFDYWNFMETGYEL